MSGRNLSSEGETAGFSEILLSFESTSDVGQRLDLLGRLIQCGVSRRNSIQPRGSIGESAKASAEGAEVLRIAGKVLSEPQLDEGVASYAILALGEWGGEDALPLIAGAAKDRGRNCRLALISALKMIGGESALELLGKIAMEDPSNPVQFAALAAIEELAAGGWDDGSDHGVLPEADRQRVELTAAKTGTLEQGFQDLSNDASFPSHLRDKFASARQWIRVGK